MNTEEQIDTIMKHFDFHKVHNAMKLLDWTWARQCFGQDYSYYRPTVQELRDAARFRLYEAVSCLYSSSGGFTARYEYGTLSLSFVLEAFDAGIIE